MLECSIRTISGLDVDVDVDVGMLEGRVVGGQFEAHQLRMSA